MIDTSTVCMSSINVHITAWRVIYAAWSKLLVSQSSLIQQTTTDTGFVSAKLLFVVQSWRQCFEGDLNELKLDRISWIKSCYCHSLFENSLVTLVYHRWQHFPSLWTICDLWLYITILEQEQNKLWYAKLQF